MKWAIAICLLWIGAGHAQTDVLKDGQRVLFLGDSNTFAGRFIGYLDCYLTTRFPDRNVELINLGLPSETISGLSEPDHPYPRPNIHDRLAKALEKTKPTLVVACYGMNDGIYYPFAEDRFQKYQEGYKKLVADCEKAGAKVILMTPSPFDAQPLAKKVLPAGADKYSWVRPYEKYDADVLAKYAAWQVTWRDKGYIVIDAHTAVTKHLERMRKLDASYRVSGDGIHPDANGHFIIFREIATTLGLVNADKPTYDGRLPFPQDSAWHAKLADTEGFATFGQVRFTKANLPRGNYTLMEGSQALGTDSHGGFAKGLPLFGTKWTANKQATEVLKLALDKERLLGLAWLTDVGHKRPDTPKGIALADAQAKAKELHTKMRTLAKPNLTLDLTPTK